MKQNDLLRTTLEIAQALLGKNGVLVPLCRAISADGNIFAYSPETYKDDPSFRKAEEHQRSVVLRDVMVRKLTALAFAKTVVLTMKDPDEQVEAIKIEFHQVSVKSAIFYFPYRIEAGSVVTQPHYEVATDQIALWGTPEE